MQLTRITAGCWHSLTLTLTSFSVVLTSYWRYWYHQNWPKHRFYLNTDGCWRSLILHWRRTDTVLTRCWHCKTSLNAAKHNIKRFPDNHLYCADAVLTRCWQGADTVLTPGYVARCSKTDLKHFPDNDLYCTDGVLTRCWQGADIVLTPEYVAKCRKHNLKHVADNPDTGLTRCWHGADNININKIALNCRIAQMLTSADACWQGADNPDTGWHGADAASEDTDGMLTTSYMLKSCWAQPTLQSHQWRANKRFIHETYNDCATSWHNLYYKPRNT